MSSDDAAVGGQPDAGTLLAAWAHGDNAAAERLFELTYGELHGLAHTLLARERRDHTLQPTALVHEAWLRLFGCAGTRPAEHGRFLALASRVMRRLLVDHARRRHAEKRGGGGKRVELDTSIPDTDDVFGDVLAVDRALDNLATLSERQTTIVERRFFGGLEMEEIAGELGVSLSTVEREWRVARAYLQHELRSEK
jgi:RNA polymerase sigma factor (TIGR02999 family)